MAVFSTRIITVDTPNFVSVSRLHWHKRSKGRIYLLPNGSHVGSSAHSESRQKRDNHPNVGGRLRLLFFGLIRRGKGLEVIVDTFEQNEQLRHHFDVHIVGSLTDSPSESETLLLRKLQQLPWCTLHGHLEDGELARLFADVDAFCLPFEEGLSERRGSFMAGMAFAKPVITTKPRIPIQGLAHMDNVIFMERSTPRDMANTLSTISGLGRLQLNLIGQRAQRWYEAGYSDKVFIERFVSILGLARSDSD